MKVLVMDPLCSLGERVLSKSEPAGDTCIFIVKKDGTVLYVDTAVGTMWQVNTPEAIAAHLSPDHQAIVNQALAELQDPK